MTGESGWKTMVAASDESDAGSRSFRKERHRDKAIRSFHSEAAGMRERSEKMGVIRRFVLGAAVLAVLTLTMSGVSGVGAWTDQVIDTRVVVTDSDDQGYGYCWFRDPKTGQIIYVPCRYREDPASYLARKLIQTPGFATMASGAGAGESATGLVEAYQPSEPAVIVAGEGCRYPEVGPDGGVLNWLVDPCRDSGATAIE
jgi:hypothetical protein